MKLTAAQAKERILSGNIEGDYEVTEKLNMCGYTIPTWPHWKFQEVDLRRAKITKIGGSFTSLDCSHSTLEEIDPATQVGKSENGYSAIFEDCLCLKKAQGSFLGFTNWSRSGITEINPKTKFGIDVDGNSAFFGFCKQLRKAQGVFSGFTNWRHSGITEIDAKTQLGVDDSGLSANFEDCKKLRSITYAKKPEGTVTGTVIFRQKAPPLEAMSF